MHELDFFFKGKENAQHSELEACTHRKLVFKSERDIYLALATVLSAALIFVVVYYYRRFQDYMDFKAREKKN